MRHVALPPGRGDAEALLKWCVEQISTLARASQIDIPVTVKQLGDTAYAAGSVAFRVAGVDFNAGNTDTQIRITLPAGFTRYRVANVFLSHASHTLTTATVGLFTAAAAAGTAIVTGATAVTVSATAESTNNNLQGLTVNNANTQSYSNATLYFRVATAEGAAATCDVTVVITPIS